MKYISLLFFIFLTLTSCQKEDNKNDNPNKTDLDFISKTENRNLALLGKKVVLSNLVQIDTLIENNKGELILVILMRSDCSGCRKTAYSVGKRIDKLLDSPISIVFGNGIGVEKERLINNLDLPYVNDSGQELKSTINLFHTPSIIFMKDNIIQHVLSVFPFDDVLGYDEEQKITDFISDVIFIDR